MTERYGTIVDYTPADLPTTGRNLVMWGCPEPRTPNDDAKMSFDPDDGDGVIHVFLDDAKALRLTRGQAQMIGAFADSCERHRHRVNGLEA
jgi:hypothetical protein